MDVEFWPGAIFRTYGQLDWSPHPLNSSKVHLAAISALRYSLGVFLTTVCMIPIVLIAHRVFDGSWYANWRGMLSVSGVLTVCCFTFFFGTRILEFSAASRRNRSSQLIFPGAVWLRGIYLLVIVMGTAIMVGTYKEGDPWWDVVLPSGLILLGYFAWPRAIRIGENEIQQSRPLLGPRRIGFGEIESLVFDPTRGEAVVFGRNGQKIVHSPLHVDTERFIQRMESLSGKETTLLVGKI